MDRSIPKRPGIQTQRQTTQTASGYSSSVPRGILARPHEVQSQSRYIPISRESAIKRMYENQRQESNTLHSQAQTNQTIPIEPANTHPMDMSLPGQKSPTPHVQLLRRKKFQRLRSIAAKSTAVALVLLITLGGLLFSQSYLKLNKVFKGTTGTVAALKPNVNPNELKGEGSGRINVLLLGRGGGNHEGPDLTDSMMVASIDPINYTTTLISIPRDLWVNVPNAGVMKINSAWETGEFKYFGKVETGSTNLGAISSGFNLADKTVSQVLGINIDYNVLVNFQAFQQAVNTVGGVTVDVPTELVDPTMAWENSNNPILAEAGVQSFDGAQALLYVRSRETTSDFARAERQRAVLIAIQNKVESLGTLSNPLKISGLINTFGDNVQTDLSLSNASRLFGIVKNVSNSKVDSIGLDAAPNHYVTTGNIDGQSIVLPSAGLFNYGGIQKYIRQLLVDPYIIKENAKIMILNGTDVPGLASSEANQLKTYGYNVIGVANTPTNNWAQTSLINLTRGQDPYTQHFLEQRLGIKATNSIGNMSITTNGANFVIIIGSNEANITQAQTN